MLIDQSPDTVVHMAIRAGLEWGEDMKEMVERKIHSLTLEDEKSGLVPFMIAVVLCRDDYGLNLVYELLSMQPNVLKEYTTH